MIKKISRKNATYINLAFQYGMMALMIIRGLVVPPFAAAYIDLALLGAWLATGNIVQWLMISEGGAWQYLRQRVAMDYGKNELNGVSLSIGTGLVILLVISMLLFSIGYGISGYIPQWMGIELMYHDELILAFMLTVIGSCMAMPASMPRAVSQGMQRHIAVNISLMISEVVSLVVIFTLLIKGYGVIALGIGPLIREVIQNIINYIVLYFLMSKFSLKFKVSLSHFRSVTGNVGWNFLNSISNGLRKRVDAIIVSQFIGNESVLIVEWTKRAWEIFYLLVSRVSNSFTPALSHLYGENDSEKFVKISLKLLSVLGLMLAFIVGIGVAFNEKFVGVWLGEAFYAGDAFNSLYAAAMVTSVLVFSLYELLFSSHEIRGPAIVQFLQSVVRVLLLVATMPAIGIISIPLSIIIADLGIGLVYMVRKLSRKMKLDMNNIRIVFARMVRDICLGIMLYMIWPGAVDVTGWGHLVIDAAMFSLVMFCIIWLVNRNFRELLAEMIGKFKKRRSA